VTPARGHAETARELLASVERAEAQLAALTPDQHLQRVVTGAVKQANENLRWTVELATAQALTSVALSLATIAEERVK
jgi:phage gp46-like protein